MGTSDDGGALVTGAPVAAGDGVAIVGRTVETGAPPQAATTRHVASAASPTRVAMRTSCHPLNDFGLAYPHAR
jgi:hypothetical protein